MSWKVVVVVVLLHLRRKGECAEDWRQWLANAMQVLLKWTEGRQEVRWWQDKRRCCDWIDLLQSKGLSFLFSIHVIHPTHFVTSCTERSDGEYASFNRSHEWWWSLLLHFETCVFLSGIPFFETSGESLSRFVLLQICSWLRIPDLQSLVFSPYTSSSISCLSVVVSVVVSVVIKTVLIIQSAFTRFMLLESFCRFLLQVKSSCPDLLFRHQRVGGDVSRRTTVMPDKRMKSEAGAAEILMTKTWKWRPLLEWQPSSCLKNWANPSSCLSILPLLPQKESNIISLRFRLTSPSKLLSCLVSLERHVRFLSSSLDSCHLRSSSDFLVSFSMLVSWRSLSLWVCLHAYLHLKVVKKTSWRKRDASFWSSLSSSLWSSLFLHLRDRLHWHWRNYVSLLAPKVHLNVDYNLFPFLCREFDLRRGSLLHLHLPSSSFIFSLLTHDADFILKTGIKERLIKTG